MKRDILALQQDFIIKMTKFTSPGGEVVEKSLTKVSVTILDDHYVLKGPESEEYLEMLAVQANKRLTQVQNSNPRLSRIQVAILTALNVMDELNKLQQEHQHLIETHSKTDKK